MNTGWQKAWLYRYTDGKHPQFGLCTRIADILSDPREKEMLNGEVRMQQVNVRMENGKPVIDLGSKDGETAIVE